MLLHSHHISVGHSAALLNARPPQGHRLKTAGHEGRKKDAVLRAGVPINCDFGSDFWFRWNRCGVGGSSEDPVLRFYRPVRRFTNNARFAQGVNRIAI